VIEEERRGSKKKRASVVIVNIDKNTNKVYQVNQASKTEFRKAFGSFQQIEQRKKSAQQEPKKDKMASRNNSKKSKNGNFKNLGSTKSQENFGHLGGGNR
jgi:hypothetical protein